VSFWSFVRGGGEGACVVESLVRVDTVKGEGKVLLIHVFFVRCGECVKVHARARAFTCVAVS
jgi:hypothetical protein